MKNKNNTIHFVFLIIAIVVVGFGVYFIFKPFLVAILSAFVLWQLFKNWYKKTVKFLGGRKSIASLLNCIVILFILIVPFLFVLGLITSEINSLYQAAQKSNWSFNIGLNSEIPLLKDLGFESGKFNFESLASSGAFEGAKGVGSFLLNAIKKTYQGASTFLFATFITFFALYYFFKDGDRMLRKMMNLCPLPNRQERVLVEDFVNISRATLKGSLVIAIVQGALLGLTFWATGVSSPAIWGLIAAVLSLIPLLGVVLVWLPVSIFLFFSGQWIPALIILIIGSTIISTVDNFLRPKLVENETSLHPMLVLLSTLGGLAVFGIMGFLIGPIIIVLFLSLLRIYQSDFQVELKKMNK